MWLPLFLILLHILLLYIIQFPIVKHPLIHLINYYSTQCQMLIYFSKRNYDIFCVYFYTPFKYVSIFWPKNIKILWMYIHNYQLLQPYKCKFQYQIYHFVHFIYVQTKQTYTSSECMNATIISLVRAWWSKVDRESQWHELTFSLVQQHLHQHLWVRSL